MCRVYCVREFFTVCFSFQATMPTSKCSFVSDGRHCSYDFSSDGHLLCVPHRPCVSPDFVFDPDVCSVCSENVKFLRTLGYVDRLSQHFTSIRKSWEAVQRSAKRKGRTATWRDASLREFVLGRGSRRPSVSASASSSGPASPSTSSSGSVPPPDAGPSQPPPSAASSAPPPAPLSPPPARSPPPPPPAPAFPAEVTDLLRTLVAQLGAVQPPAPPPSPAVPATAAPVPSTDPGQVPSVPPSQYGAPSSPTSEDDGEQDAQTPLLPRGWAPVPSTWEVGQDGDQWVLRVPDPAAGGAMTVAPNKQVRWGSSLHAPAPQWHFRAGDLPPRAPPTIPCHSPDQLYNALDSLGMWAGLAPAVLDPEVPGPSRRTMGLPWIQGLALPYLTPLRDWWPQAVVKQQPGPPPRVAPRSRAHMFPLGAEWDEVVGRYLLARPSSFPPPLAAPSAEAVRMAERDRGLSLESFSGLSALLAVEALMRQMAGKADLGELVSPSLLCEYFLPVLRCAIHQLAPSVSADFGRALTAQMAVWHQAVAPLPPATQTALLTTDPCSPAFGSPRAVTEALSRAPQVHVVYQGHATPRPGPSKSGKPAAVARFKAAPPSSARRPHRQDQRHPYPARPARPPHGGDGALRPARDAPTSSRRPSTRPFRDAASHQRGARR